MSNEITLKRRETCAYCNPPTRKDSLQVQDAQQLENEVQRLRGVSTAHEAELLHWRREYDALSNECAAKDAEIQRLREALAPFANRCAEKAMGGKYSALTDRQWRRALETYQECPGGDMCGCKPREEKPAVKESLTSQSPAEADAKWREPDWLCPFCNTVNLPIRTRCRSCNNRWDPSFRIEQEGKR